MKTRRITTTQFWLWLVLLAVLCGCATNHPIIITAPARMEDRGKWTYLTIADGTYQYEMAWAMPPHYAGLVPLVPDQIYTFTIQSEQFMGHRVPNVVRVVQGGQAIYDREICEVHHQKMERKKVPVVYGGLAPAQGAAPPEVEHSLFPNYREVALRGYGGGPGSPKTERVFVCSECKAAYLQWSAQNSTK